MQSGAKHLYRATNQIYCCGKYSYGKQNVMLHLRPLV